MSGSCWREPCRKSAHTFTLVCANTNMFTDIHTIQTHKHHPEVLNGWVVFKEAQKSVNVKGQTNLGSKTERDSISTPGSGVGVCV